MILRFLLLLLLFSAFPYAQEDLQVRQTLQQLFSEQQAIVDQAKEKILALGNKALPQLREYSSLFTYLLSRIEGAPSPSRKFIEDYYSQKFSEAQKLYQTGKHNKAIELIDAVFTLENNLGLRNEFTRLRSACKEELFRQEILTATLLVDTPYQEMGSQIPLLYFLKNQTAQEIFIPKEVVQSPGNWFSAKEVLSSQLVLSIKIFSRDSFGNTSLSTKEELSLIDQDIRLTQNEQFRLEVFFDTNTFSPEQFFYREFEITLTLHPSEFNLGGRPSFKSQIKSPPLLLKVFPKGLLQFKNDPLKLVTQLYQSKQYDKLYFACLLLHQKQKVLGIDYLIQALPQAEIPERELLIICLKELSGQKFGLNLDTWKYWWKAEKKRFELAEADGSLYYQK